MSGVIFRETLRRHWRQVLYWGLGIAFLGFYAVAIKGDVDMLDQYAELVGSMPPALIQMFGIDDAAALATPDGFVAFAFYGYTQLLLAVFAVAAGLNITANEEDEGILDIVLAQPVPRWRVILEKYAGFAVIAVLVVAIATVGLMLGNEAATLKADAGRMIQSSINILPSLLLMIAVTAFAGALFRRRSTAMAVTAAFIVASYFVNFLGSAASGSLAATLSALSFFHYFDSQTVMMEGLNVGNMAVLLAAAAVLIAGTLWAFERRDVGV